MKVVVMGTPDFAVPSLAEILSAGHEVLRVYTQPPRRAGRGQRVVKSPVHQFADIMGVPVETPESFRKPSTIDGLADLNADAACVIAYGQILPRRALDAPHHGCLNLHASLLPRWRGAAPIHRAILAGDDRTGVQVMRMAPGLDTGDILLSETVEIGARDTTGSLSDRLSRIGAGLWPPALAALERGALTATPQTGEVTYAAKIDKAEARIDWTHSATEIDRLIRALNPAPGAWCEAGGARLKIHAAKPVAAMAGPPGTLRGTSVACGEGAMELVRVQPAGKPAMAAADWVNGADVERLT